MLYFDRDAGSVLGGWKAHLYLTVCAHATRLTVLTIAFT